MKASTAARPQQLAHETGEPDLQLVPSPGEEGFLDTLGKFILAHGAVEVPGAKDPVDYTLSVPMTLGSRVIVGIDPGFGGVKRSSRGLRNALAGQEHVAALSFEPVRKGGFVNDLLNPQKVHIDTLAAILQDLPNNKQLREIPNGRKLDLGSVTWAVHSMASLAATEYARLHPDETQALLYMGAIGLEGRKVGLGFIPRLVQSGSGDVAGKYVQGKLVPGANRIDLAFRAARYYLCNPLRTIGEIGSCFTADLEKQLMLLDILDVDTAALFFSAEKLVPVTQETLAKARELVDLCEVMEGYGHLAPQRHPYEVAAKLGNISTRLGLGQSEQPDLVAAAA